MPRDLEQDASVVLGAEARGWTDELGDLDRLHTGLLAPPFVGATVGATVAVDLVEEEQAALVEQRCQPSKRTHRRGLEVGVERRERDSTDPSSQSVIEGVVEVADNEFHAANPRRFARERPRGQRFELFGKPAKRVTCEQPPASDLRLLAPQAAQLTAQHSRRRALGDAELDDVPGDAYGAAHREAQDLLARHRKVDDGAMRRGMRAHDTARK